MLIRYIKEKLGKANVVNQPDANYSKERNKELGIRTFEDIKNMAPMERSKLDTKLKPKMGNIAKGRQQIAKDALKREKELKAIDQGVADAD